MSLASQRANLLMLNQFNESKGGHWVFSEGFKCILEITRTIRGMVYYIYLILTVDYQKAGVGGRGNVGGRGTGRQVS